VVFLIGFSSKLYASPPPCTIWQVKVTSHPVKKYKRLDGTEYSKTSRDEHCREKFPAVIDWQDRFINNGLKNWPESKEKFKSWKHSEKEAVLKALSIQPQILKNLKVKILRGIQSKSLGNPGAAVKKLHTIAFYDEFFKSPEQAHIVSHELIHIYLHSLDPEKLSDLVAELGWGLDKVNSTLTRKTNTPKLKSDSDQSMTEDIANHLEDYLHDNEGLREKFPKRYELIKRLVPSDFKLEKL
jgi:hypothetical protein